ncbi:hypothetical protein HYS95_02270 [Candidatus Daviesbacteria bacterium]|nr:hypothetical protein [Candidatus Daviesbacteria bacterium]
MAGPAPIEQETSTKVPDNVVQFVPDQEARFRHQVAEEAGKMDNSFQPEHAIPPADQPVHNKNILHIQPGINAEPFIDTKDLADRMQKVAGQAAELVDSDKGILHRVETASNTEAHPAVFERVKKMLKAA